jgi:repressor LexA
MEKNQYMGCNFIERLQYYMKSKGINDNQMTVSAGLSVGLIGKAKSSKGMTSSNIEKILLAYPDINSDWLLTGRGNMLSSDNGDNAVRQTPEPAAKRVMDDDKEGIPLIPLDAVAGFPATDSSYAYMENCDRYIIPEFQDKGADFIIRVSGDSMIPLYYNGDLIACHKIHDIRFFQWGTVYVLETSQGILVKRIMESTDHDDCILCTSENDTVHRPFLLPKDDIRSMSTIVGLIRIV